MASQPDKQRVRFSEIRIPPEEAVALAVAVLEFVEAAWRHKRAALAAQVFHARRDTSAALLYKGGTRDLVRRSVKRGS
jgi:hypothetical protein